MANKVYVFDWGDTLMVDFPDEKIAMKDWETVEAVEGAKEALCALAKRHKIYVATGASKTTPNDIKAALLRVGLSEYVTDYFCNTRLGVNKPSKEFYQKIIELTGTPPEDIYMVGDSLERDVLPAIELGIQGVWFNPKKLSTNDIGFRQIECLTDLFV